MALFLGNLLTEIDFSALQSFCESRLIQSCLPIVLRSHRVAKYNLYSLAHVAILWRCCIFRGIISSEDLLCYQESFDNAMFGRALVKRRGSTGRSTTLATVLISCISTLIVIIMIKDSKKNVAASDDAEAPVLVSLELEPPTRGSEEVSFFIINCRGTFEEVDGIVAFCWLISAI